SLADVVEFFDRGGDFTASNKDARIVPLGLTAEQRAQLTAFLGRPLTDARVASRAAPFDEPELFTDGDLVPHVLLGSVSGSSGHPPTPVALDAALAGNPSFTVGVYGALGGATAVLVVDDAPPGTGSIPSAGSFARVAVTLAGAGASGGFGSAVLAIPADPA